MNTTLEFNYTSIKCKLKKKRYFPHTPCEHRDPLLTHFIDEAPLWAVPLSPSGDNM
jgi:hypothetical protein